MNAATDIDMNAVALFAPEARMAATDVNHQKSGSESFSEILRASDSTREISDQKHQVRGIEGRQDSAAAGMQNGAQPAGQGGAERDQEAIRTSQSRTEGQASSGLTSDLATATQRQGLPVAGKAGPIVPGLMSDIGLKGEPSDLAMARAWVTPQSQGSATSVTAQMPTSSAPLATGPLTSNALSAVEISGQPLAMKSVAALLNGADVDRGPSLQGGANPTPSDRLAAERLSDLGGLSSSSKFNVVSSNSELGRATPQTQGLGLEQPVMQAVGGAILRGAKPIGREGLGLSDRSIPLRGSMSQGLQTSGSVAQGFEDFFSRRGPTIEGLTRASWMTNLVGTGTTTHSVATPASLPQPLLNMSGSQGQEVGLLPTTLRLPSGFELSGGTAQGQLLSSVHQPAWGQELAQQAKFMVRDALKFAELKLTPANLGTVEVVVKQEDQQTTLMFFAKNPAVREALEASLQRLQKSFEDDGLNLEGTFVSDQSLSEHRQQATEDFSEGTPGVGHSSDMSAAPASKAALPLEIPESDRLLDIWA
ncbi:MAG: flagellar hook-length control protein FliK [Pseudomonadales bacterium]